MDSTDRDPANTPDITIDELAQRTRLTVRNIRAYQSRGLVQPPTLRGRTGYYGPDHIARIELIRELQAEGFNLEAIRRLLEEAGGETDEVLRFTRAVREMLGKAHYYATYLLKTNGAAEEEWRPFAERTRQIFRFLAEHQEPGALAQYEQRVAEEFQKSIQR